MKLLSATYVTVSYTVALVAIAFLISAIMAEDQPIAGRFAALLIGACSAQSALANLMNYYRGHPNDTLGWLVRAASGLSLAVAAALAAVSDEIHNEIIIAIACLGFLFLLSFAKNACKAPE